VSSPLFVVSQAAAAARSLFFTQRFFAIAGGLALVHLIAFFLVDLRFVATGLLIVALSAWGVDVILLVAAGEVTGERELSDRLSNGDENAVRAHLESTYPFLARVTVMDELPEQFQERDMAISVRLPPGEERTVRYTVRPTERGEYQFGVINVLVRTPVGLMERRFACGEETVVPVYPSYLQMRAYSLLAASDRLHEVGVKKVRQLGHTMEFDHIREYVTGDDYRTINWKASARRGDLMVNQYREERSQPVYCLINAGRVMRMPFEGMTLLDHSINAALVLSNIAIMKHDRAGIIGFSNTVSPVVPASRRNAQMRYIQEALYNLETDFLEPDYEKLVAHVRSDVRGRSLLLLFTNFMAKTSLERQLPYLQMLTRYHTLVVIFFENTELEAFLQARPQSTAEIYEHAIAEKFAHEQREIIHELEQRGIYAVHTKPEDLSTATINKYLELKARGIV
jgi:uncharacterized protein (DUF58 family)